MMTADGSIILLEFTLEDEEPKVKISRPQINQVSILTRKVTVYNPKFSKFHPNNSFSQVSLKHHNYCDNFTSEI